MRDHARNFFLGYQKILFQVGTMLHLCQGKGKISIVSHSLLLIMSLSGNVTLNIIFTHIYRVFLSVMIAVARKKITTIALSFMYCTGTRRVYSVKYRSSLTLWSSGTGLYTRAWDGNDLG